MQLRFIRRVIYRFIIEEDSFADTIQLVGDRLGHFHVESPDAYAERKAEVV